MLLLFKDGACPRSESSEIFALLFAWMHDFDQDFNLAAAGTFF
jgi:hypothetical protein